MSRKTSQRGENNRRITRRAFLGGLAAGAGAAAGGVFPARTVTASRATPDGRRLLELVNPFVGVEDEGQTVPGAKVPFGFATVSPDTTDPGEFYNTSGYDSHGAVLGFSQTHVSGTGGRGKYGNFRLTPLTGEPRVSDPGSGKGEETASPGYYSVVLSRNGIQAELTATRMCGFHRYSFPEGETPVVMLDATSLVEIDDRAAPTPVSFRQRPTRSEVRVAGGNRIEGSASFEGGWNPGPYTLHFCLEFDQPSAESGTFSGGKLQRGAASAVGGRGEGIGAYAAFEPDGEGAVVHAKIGLSWIGPEKARKNLEAGITGWDFDAVRSRAEAAWEEVLSKVRVEGGAEEQRRIFYTALYRTHFMPHDLSGENAAFGTAAASIGPHYEDYYALWDTFRTVHPLLTLIQPERQSEMVQSLITTYVDTGWMPDARIAGSNGLTQGGSHADVLIADAIVKGLPGIDYERAYEALQKNAGVEPERALFEGRGGISEYKTLGYVSLDTERSGTRTVEYAHDDFCVAQVAYTMGDWPGYQEHLSRSLNWKNLWDAESEAIRPRHSDGTFLEDFDRTFEYPGEIYEVFAAPFYEGSAYQYSTYVPHDAQGLINLLGGDEAFVAWLDKLFESGVYTQDNEPDILAPYLYIHAARHDRTAERVRELLASEYNTRRLGLPGNDDAGTMSSWYVWGAMGLYPNAGQSYYYIGSPVFKRTTLRLGGGLTFTVEAPRTSEENLYVREAYLNGIALGCAWLRHSELAGGGVLYLRMGAEPSGWGADERPPSVSYPVS